MLSRSNLSGKEQPALPVSTLNTLLVEDKTRKLICFKTVNVIQVKLLKLVYADLRLVFLG